MIRDTQLESWIKTQPELGPLQTLVYQFIEEQGGAASFQAAHYLHRPFHVIAPRVTELVKEGRLQDSGKRIWNEKTKRKVIVWSVAGHTSMI